MSDQKEPDPLLRAAAWVVSTRPVSWLYLHVFPHIDRPLLRLSRGRLSVSLGMPVVLLETVGARSGQPRTTPLVYALDGEDVILIASKGGSPHHPAWYHNLRKHPTVHCTLRGARRRYRAREAQGAERTAAWRKALQVYPGYARYQDRAGKRRIPVFVLEPA